VAVQQDQLRIDARHTPERVVLCLRGELDLATTPLLSREIEGVDLGTTATVVLDLQGLEFMDSTGLRAVLAAQQRLLEYGGAFAVTRGSPQVQRLLAVTRADEHLLVIGSPDEPLAQGRP
jgi:anti-sigma B factor antagonist